MLLRLSSVRIRSMRSSLVEGANVSIKRGECKGKGIEPPTRGLSAVFCVRKFVGSLCTPLGLQTPSLVCERFSCDRSVAHSASAWSSAKLRSSGRLAVVISD